MTPNARFTEFITDITPSTTTNNRSAAAHTSVRNALTNDADYKNEVIRTFLGGSYKRKTAIRPVMKDGETERPDVDIYVVVNGSEWSKSPEDIINDLYSALNRSRTELNITRLKRNRCSIAVSTDKADMDVSPLLERSWSGFYRIGNRNTGEWYNTDPEGHTTWSASVNKGAGNRFNPMVKMLKWNRREFPTKNKHPKSIALEALVAKHMSRTETHYGKLLHDTFDDIVSAYSMSRFLGTCPTIEDPCVPGGDLLGGVSGEAFSAYYDKLEYFRDEARKGLDSATQETATKHWRRILGQRFPAPKSTGTTNSSALKSSIGVSPLSFPAKASTPPNKPADFA
ncbi:hypothetical protein RHODOSMS8_02445 [Rhodobiaceae bacterium]|nr:hypothetical protein RHODOSMS8_02445 [Rhodobiaceae bacterium]